MKIVGKTKRPALYFVYTKIMGKGQNYEFHNVENQKEHQKKFKGSEHRKDLLKGSERRKRKRSEH